MQAERQSERPVMVLDLGNPGDAALATPHARREVVDSGKDDGDPGQDLVAVLQKDAEGGVVQDDREVDLVALVFAGEIIDQAGLVVFRGEALEIQVFDRRLDFGIGGSKTLQHPFNLVVRPLVALVIRVENQD